MENRKEGSERDGRDIGRELLFVVLVALGAMRQATGRIVRLRAQVFVPFGVERANRNVLLPGQIRHAGASGSGGVAREEHRRQKESQIAHPPESHVIPRVARRSELAEAAVAPTNRCRQINEFRTGTFDMDQIYAVSLGPSVQRAWHHYLMRVIVRV